ncbi:hypothetical protein DACRYDRAFT_111104 [Dacryopinax primogenitus]|uniref:Uncharacterized protein n=1 Tax=Dacryopinax primogenitus (strain DJM 731) TaxID=1858805 RepID=M5FSG8_DACPD|nr:uncharacterized protein DACRYDRAFT_111104 [Dacryopinax primogenitus]EJT98124.1 hypothetical protein DACRYDRAFT_111104 [Dacryopinax primogenitus]
MATYKQYMKNWERDRKEAEKYPLTRRITLNGTSAEDDFDHPVSTIDVHAALAVVPYCPPTGEDRWAQVWLASVHLLSGNQTHPVVVKLFQESLFPRTDPTAFEYYCAWSAAALCEAEAWGYEQAKPLQGLLLPHSNGFYRFELPCEQIVVGHVMEYIEGHPLERDFDGMIDGSFYSPESQLETILPQLSLSVYCLHLCGVHHGDLSPNNVLLLPGKPSFFIFIDLDQCSPLLPNPYGKPDSSGLCYCLQELESGEKVTAWLEEELVRSKAWAIDVFTSTDGFDDLKESTLAIEDQYQGQAGWMKEEKERQGSTD